MRPSSNDYSNFRPVDLGETGVIFGEDFKRLAPMYKGYHMNDCPPAFNQPSGNMWTRFVSRWFFRGLTPQEVATLVPKPGIDKPKALAHILAVLRSFEPDHGSKEAIAGFLMSLWFEPDLPSPATSTTAQQTSRI